MKAASVLALAFLLAACRQEAPATGDSAGTTGTPAAASSAPPAAGEPRDMTEKKIDRKLAHEPTYLESSMLGTGTAQDGTVATESSKFKRGEVVLLTMKLRESPAGLQTRVEWKDVNGLTVHEEKRPMNGAKVVTFALKKKLEPGGYKAIGYWGGNVACEIPFTVAEK